MMVSTLKFLQQLCTSYYFFFLTLAGSLKLLRNTYTLAGPSLCSVGQIICCDPPQKGKKNGNFSLQHIKSHQWPYSVTIKHWVMPFVRNCKRLQMKLKCSFSGEEKPEQSPEMWWQTITVRPSLHTIGLLFPSDSPSFQRTDFLAAEYHAALLQSIKTASAFHPRGFPT